MKLTEKLGLAALHRMDPEKAHGMAITALKSGLTPTPGPVTSTRLKTLGGDRFAEPGWAGRWV